MFLAYESPGSNESVYGSFEREKEICVIWILNNSEQFPNDGLCIVAIECQPYGNEFRRWYSFNANFDDSVELLSTLIFFSLYCLGIFTVLTLLTDYTQYRLTHTQRNNEYCSTWFPIYQSMVYTVQCIVSCEHEYVRILRLKTIPWKCGKQIIINDKKEHNRKPYSIRLIDNGWNERLLFPRQCKCNGLTRKVTSTHTHTETIFIYNIHSKRWQWCILIDTPKPLEWNMDWKETATKKKWRNSIKKSTFFDYIYHGIWRQRDTKKNVHFSVEIN